MGLRPDESDVSAVAGRSGDEFHSDADWRRSGIDLGLRGDQAIHPDMVALGYRHGGRFDGLRDADRAIIHPTALQPLYAVARHAVEGGDSLRGTGERYSRRRRLS